MSTRRHFPIAVFVLALCFGTAARADQIITAPAGGPWNQGSTWLGNTVPTAYDEVFLSAPVTLAGDAACASLEISATGSLAGALHGPTNLVQVSGAVTNHGSISLGPYRLDLEVGGELYNAGTWHTSEIALTGSGPRNISHGPGNSFTTNLLVAEGSDAVLRSTGPLKIIGHIDMTGGRLDLDIGSPLTLINCEFRGPMNANGNEVAFRTWSYLQNCSIDDVVLVGEVEAAHQVEFSTRVVVMDTLRNQSSTGGGAITVYGDMINKGIILAPNYSFPINISGDFETHGLVACTQLVFMGVGVEHRLRMGPEGSIAAFTFLPEFQAATLIAETPVRFSKSLLIGVGTLVLEPGASLSFSSFSGIGSGTVLAGGNSITCEGSSGLGSLTLDEGVFSGTVPVLGILNCTNGLTVEGTLTSWTWLNSDVTVEGLLRNTGTISDGAHPVIIRALNDLENLGTMSNSSVFISGTVDQQVAIGDGLATENFVIEANLEGSEYQWYRDGELIPGETGTTLVFNTVGAADLGRYICRAGQYESRVVTISQALGVSAVPSVALVTLDQNRPNPFNPTTSFSFLLAQDAEVSLVVYDLAGREIDRLVDEPLAAGSHEVVWTPKNVASGMYLYRLRAGNTVLGKRCLLVK